MSNAKGRSLPFSSGGERAASVSNRAAFLKINGQTQAREALISELGLRLLEQQAWEAGVTSDAGVIPWHPAAHMDAKGMSRKKTHQTNNKGKVKAFFSIIPPVLTIAIITDKV
jgi:hypothetical protein